MNYKTTDYLPLLREALPPVEDTVEFILESDQFANDSVALKNEGYEFNSFTLMIASGSQIAKAIWKKDCK